MRFPTKVSLVLCAILLAACAAQPPYRDLAAPAPSGPQCAEVYRAADQQKTPDEVEAAIGRDLEAPDKAACWTTTWEKHADYDLFTVEFDDQGWLAGSASDPERAAGQIARLMKYLEDLAGPKGAGLPLSVVLYTHGWHHSAAPADGNMIRFRAWLSDTVALEGALCRENRRAAGLPDSGPGVCSETEAVELPFKRRHVLGIYVGWRGDSILGPGIENASIWDRKLAAEKVALGAVQELYARLHHFWKVHSDCRKVPAQNCADVRLLTLGHSFGGLITFRALAPRLMTGVVESDYPVGAGWAYAYGFGDLSVLVNPAFEGTRYEPLAMAASGRKYQTGPDHGRSAQLPQLIVAQSKGDVATGDFFPLFRGATTLFEHTEGAERAANVETVGWDARYVTHTLSLAPADACGSRSPEADLRAKLKAEAQWYDRRCAANFRDFDRDELDFCDGLVVRKAADRESAHPLARPAFLPLWVLQADKSVIADHNDYLDPHFLDFVRQIYYTIERATDLRVLSAAGKLRAPGRCN